jgi:hypothetical protein
MSLNAAAFLLPSGIMMAQSTFDASESILGVFKGVFNRTRKWQNTSMLVVTMQCEAIQNTSMLVVWHYMTGRQEYQHAGNLKR